MVTVPTKQLTLLRKHLFYQHDHQAVPPGGNAGENDPFGVDDLIPRLRIPDGEMRDLEISLPHLVDRRRYDVSSCQKKGTVTIEWKRIERSRHWSKYIAAMRALSDARKPPMHLSRTSVVGWWQKDGSLDRSAHWAHCHSAWVYGTTPSVPLSPNRLLPAAARGVLAPPLSSRNKLEDELIGDDNVFLESDDIDAGDIGNVEELVSADDDDDDWFAGLLPGSSDD